MSEARQVRVALVNDYPVVVQGLNQLLAGDDRLAVVELDSAIDPSQRVDVVLFDTFASTGEAGGDVVRLLGDPRVARLAVYTWNTGPAVVAEALAVGVHAFLSKALDGDALADAIVRVHTGEQVVLAVPVTDETEQGEWPGRPFGLTAREAEVLGLITQGVTNTEIARRCFLSINSVKSYIRSAYRKIGVERRSQAVRWGMEHAMLPQPRIQRLDPPA